MYRPPPQCPHCHVPVYRGKGHRCRYSVGLPAVPPPLVAMPDDFRAKLDAQLAGWRERLLQHAQPEPVQDRLL